MRNFLCALPFQNTVHEVEPAFANDILCIFKALEHASICSLGTQDLSMQADSKILDGRGCTRPLLSIVQCT